jgi:hypothetical protein
MPQPCRGLINDFLVGTERCPAGAPIVVRLVRHGFPSAGAVTAARGEAEPVQGTSGNTINTAAEKLIICPDHNHGAS